MSDKGARRPLAGLLGVVVLLALALVTSASACAGPCGQADYDGDGLYDWADNCPRAANASQKDTDADAPLTLFDLGPGPKGTPLSEESPLRVLAQAPLQTDPAPLPADPAAGGDACDEDDDADGIRDRRTSESAADNCRLVPNPDQADADRDGTGDPCDETPAGAVASADPAAPAAASGPAVVRATPPRSLRFDAVGTGVIVPVTCTARCTVTGTLTVDRRSSARLVLPKGVRTLVLGRGSAFLEARGRTYLYLPVAARTLRRLAKATPRLRPLVRITVTGGPTVVSRRLTLRR